MAPPFLLDTMLKSFFNGAGLIKWLLSYFANIAIDRKIQLCYKI